jgi:hypothetical protein
MENDKKIVKNAQDLFVRYSDEMSKACERAVRDALLKHKLAGNPIAVSRDGKVVILQPDEIDTT